MIKNNKLYVIAYVNHSLHPSERIHAQLQLSKVKTAGTKMAVTEKIL